MYASRSAKLRKLHRSVHSLSSYASVHSREISEELFILRRVYTVQSIFID